MSTRTKKAVIKDEEWVRVQPIIRKLYLLEDKSLKDVITILGIIHDFHPSENQLGTKLKQWHMTKKMTSLEWKHVNARIRRRRLQGKESKVYLSGIPLRPATVEKARSRHSFESTLDKLAGKAPPSPKDVSLIIRTPSPPAEARVFNARNIPWLLAKDFLGGANLGAVLQSRRSNGSMRLPMNELLSLALHNRSELPSHTSKLQYTFQALALIMPEMVMQSHVFFAESLLLSPYPGFNNSESLEVLLFLFSNNFLEGDKYTIKDRENEVVVVGNLLNIVKTSRVLDSLVTQQLAKLPLSLQSALDRLFKEAVQRSDLDLVQSLLRIGVDVNQRLRNLRWEFGALTGFTAFEYAALVYDEDLIRILTSFAADTRIKVLILVYMAFSRMRKIRTSTSKCSVTLLLSNYCFNTRSEGGTQELFQLIELDVACPISEQIIEFFRAKVRRPKSISALLVAAVKSQSRLAFDLLSEKQQFINIANLNGQTPLTAAICIGSIHHVKYLLQLGANHSPRVQIIESRPVPFPLQYAAFYADVNIVRHLLREGADINFCHSSDAFDRNEPPDSCETTMINLGRTALQAAILGTNTEVALFILAAGARLVGGELALSIRSRQQIITEALLSRGASLEENSAAFEYGSVLEAAVLAEDVGLISRIIQINEKAVDERALWAAIFVAKYSSNLAIANLVVAQYARLGAVKELWLGTAVHLAAQLNLCKIAESLLASGMQPAIHAYEWIRNRHDAQIPMPESYFRWREAILETEEPSRHMPLVHGAIQLGRPDYLRLLLRFGYRMPPCCPTVDMKNTSLELLQILHEHGTNMTPQILGESIKHGLQPANRWLLSLNIDLRETVLDEESKVLRGRTPIQAAAEQGDTVLFERLLILGADINAPPITRNGGATALQLASIKGYFGLVGKMLDLHADPNAPGADMYGRTALEGAAEHGRLDVVQLLLNSGVQTCGDGRRQYVRAIGFARQEGHHAVVALLKSHRPWTEADQEVLEDNTLLHYDQTSEGIAKELARIRSLVKDENQDDQDEDMMSEASEEEEARYPKAVDTGSVVHEYDPEEAGTLPLPSSTLEEVRETLRDGDETPSLPGDAIWTEAYQNWSAEWPWQLE